MDAEILFFMSNTDQTEFLKVANKQCDSMSENSGSQLIIFHIGSCQLLFTPSVLSENSLFTGKLEIRLSAISEQVTIKDQERAKTIFRKLRNWLKKNYLSRLAYLNQNKNNKLTPSRNHWLGPDAKLWKEQAPEKHLLKLSKTSWMVFELGY